jgi:hypothetical protein
LYLATEINNIKKNEKKKTKCIYWTATTIIALFEGVMPALTSKTELAKKN